MTKEFLVKVINDFPSDSDINIVLLNNSKIYIKNIPGNKTKASYELKDEYIKIITAEDKRERASVSYIPYHQIAYIEGKAIVPELGNASK